MLSREKGKLDHGVHVNGRGNSSSTESPTAQPPYLTLTIPEAAALADPPAPEPRRFDSFVHLLDHRAQHEAEKIAVGFPACPGTQRANDSCLQWMYSDLARLAKACMHPLREALGDASPLPQDGKQPVVAILAPSGPEFLLHALACWRLGAAVMPIALGTTAGGIVNLIQLTGCRRLLFHDKQAELAKEVEESLHDGGKDAEFRLARWTGLSGILQHQAKDPPLPIYEATPQDTLVIFHSSGSTGNPKPIPQLIRFWTASLISAAGRDAAAYTTTPLYHGGLSDLFRALQAAAPIYFFPWHEAKAPTTSNIIGSLEACQKDIRFFLSVPFILEMLSKDASGIKTLQAMDLVSTGGAPLPEDVGNLLAAQHNVKLVSRMGSSECGFLMSSWRAFDTEKDWSWLRRPREAGEEWLVFERQDEEPGVYELVVQEQWPTKLLSNRKGGQFATGDLYEQHKEHSDRWRYARRADDAVVMVNGKKIASAAVESHFKASGKVTDVLVFGDNRPLLGAIVLPASAEPDADEQARQRHFLSQMKPALHDLNSKLPSHARIPSEMLHVADKALFDNLPRSSKGTLQRGLALQQLAPLIDRIYAHFEEGTAPSLEPKENLQGDELRKWLENTVGEVCAHTIARDDDFFQSGIDSIMAARIRAAIHQKIDMDGRKLGSNAVYENPTIDLLAAHIEGSSAKEQASDEQIRQVAGGMLSRYGCNDSGLAKRRCARKATSTILLTGATGALGTRVLEIACRSAKVDAVICLARAADEGAATERIRKSLQEKQCRIDDDVFASKVTCAARLTEALKDRLRNAERLVVIHCAWTVNFALRLESFEKDCIAPLRELLQLSAECDNAGRFVFCSSVASVLAADAPHTETISANVSDAGATGYGQSKWVAERICESFRKSAGLPITVARIGQLCGDMRNGIWNETEAWPLLVRTANETGVLPENGPDVDWLPVDVAASSVIDLALQEESETPTVHICLPHRKARLPWIQFVNGLGLAGLSFQSVPKADWLEAVGKAGTQVRGRALLRIWEKMPESGSPPTVETSEAEKACPALRDSQGVNTDLVAKFVSAWRASKFLK